MSLQQILDNDYKHYCSISQQGQQQYVQFIKEVMNGSSGLKKLLQKTQDPIQIHNYMTYDDKFKLPQDHGFTSLVKRMILCLYNNNKVGYESLFPKC